MLLPGTVAPAGGPNPPLQNWGVCVCAELPATGSCLDRIGCCILLGVHGRHVCRLTRSTARVTGCLISCCIKPLVQLRVGVQAWDEFACLLAGSPCCQCRLCGGLMYQPNLHCRSLHIQLLSLACPHTPFLLSLQHTNACYTIAVKLQHPSLFYVHRRAAASTPCPHTSSNAQTCTPAHTRWAHTFSMHRHTDTHEAFCLVPDLV